MKSLQIMENFARTVNDEGIIIKKNTETLDLSIPH